MPSDWNTKVIEEFRANGGTVANFGGALLLLHTTGARTGQEHVTPVMYRKVDDGYAVFASFAGQPRNPAWYHNLVANPSVQAEIGTQTLRLHARVADDAERGPIWTSHKTEFPGFQEYEDKTTRQIPVVILEPAS
ncbi:MAG: nitroreductase family deazaflavin-dependent oxidoreductase [Streptosporangiaceae bacterium]